MNSIQQRWEMALSEMPLVAILRGLTPENAVGIGAALVESGFRLIEVPLNSPSPYETIRLLSESFGERAIIGAGTVLSASQANEVIEAGGELIVSPNIDLSVAGACKGREVIYCPGVMTPSEAFFALANGATALKLFPAEVIPPSMVKAMRAVLPKKAELLAVGGISVENMQPYLDAGANGFGIGSSLFKPEKPVDAIRQSAEQFVRAYRELADTPAKA